MFIQPFPCPLKAPSPTSITLDSHYAEEIWKRVFIFTVRLTVYTNLSRKRSFSKTLFESQKFENAGFAFRCGGNNIWKWGYDVMIITWFLCPSFPQTQIQKWPVIVALLNFSGVVWRENIWCVFRVKCRFQSSSAKCARSLRKPLVRKRALILSRTQTYFASIFLDIWSYLHQDSLRYRLTVSSQE